ncbi:MAG TPA: GNAT family protein [Methanoregula sp.]|nr:GNAT family protein [Methanoregula sp.]
MVFSLSTGRLILEDLNKQDIDHIRYMACDPAIMKYVFIWLENEEQVTGFVRHAMEEAARPDRQGYILAVRIPKTGDFAGFVLLETDKEQPSTAEMGCILRQEYWKNGYASEIVRALLGFGFGTLGLHRVYAKCDELNTASAHCLEKGGLVYEGTLREHVWLRDHWRSSRYYGMLAEEFRARQ